jgi:hypothetical protein
MGTDKRKLGYNEVLHELSRHVPLDWPTRWAIYDYVMEQREYTAMLERQSEKRPV